MRLLNTSTLKLTTFIDVKIPPYAILSHTWESEEVLFADLDADPSRKAGWAKVTAACKIALQRRYQWIWIDTCCIDKSSSAELSEAINCMFKWYQKAHVCLAYLADVSYHSPDSEECHKALASSRWFTRGWTLQELLAPKIVEFYSSDWRHIATQTDIRRTIQEITGIDEVFIQPHDRWNIHDASIAKRMSWASARNTTRVEDLAYCLLGIFDVNMPLIYGEGLKAFKRLQEVVLREADDMTIFAWGLDNTITEFDPDHVRRNMKIRPNLGDLFAEHPSNFKSSGDIVPIRFPDYRIDLRIYHDCITMAAPLWALSRNTKARTLMMPLPCKRRSNPFECIALRVSSPSIFTGDELALEALNDWNISCYRASPQISSIPISVWSPNERFTVSLKFKAPRGEPPFRANNMPYAKEFVVLRTLPAGLVQSDSWPDRETDWVGSYSVFGLSGPVFIRLKGTQAEDLALVLQPHYVQKQNDHYSEDQRASPHFIKRLVAIPEGHSLEDVRDIVILQTETWSLEDIYLATDWEGQDAENEASATPSASILRHDKLPLVDGFKLAVTKNKEFGSEFYLVDVIDLEGENVSLVPTLDGLLVPF
ncbi:heterokaryon incompatibility protein [Colletotrichum kahawae]|uniref:Heterokaryon incompatibility protein n=1 Tax=Colletotrichum kahawae TaxID=34407 RepID=A0AAE0D1D5_COLKA|nr:heterokaryon incompatibility protein [Colletotrichum kahawae]